MMEAFDDSRAMLRYGVELYYATTLDSPPRKEWDGHCGIIAHICDVFNLPHRKQRVVRRILKNLAWCEKHKIKFNGKDMRQYNRGRSAVILEGNDDESIIGD